MHKCATPQNYGIDCRSVWFTCSFTLPKKSLFSLSQSTVDGFFSTQSCTPKFTTASLLNYIIELVICEDKVRLLFRYHAYWLKSLSRLSNWLKRHHSTTFLHTVTHCWITKISPIVLRFEKRYSTVPNWLNSKWETNWRYVEWFCIFCDVHLCL